LGEKIFIQELNNETSMQIDISDLPSGVYVAEIKSAEERWISKLVKE
jgi:hypothetical protein